MATSVGSITFEIQASLKDIQGQLRTLEGQFGATANKISSSFKSIGTSIGGIFTVGALSAYISKIIDLGDQLSDLADITGLSIEVLGGLRVVTEQNGSSLGAFATGMLKAQRGLGEISEEGQGAALALKALGLNIDEVRKLSPDQFLETFAAALGKVEDRNLRAAIATRVLGKAGAELLPTLLAIADNGLTKLDGKTADAYRSVGAFKDQMVRLGAIVADLTVGPIAGFTESLEKILKLLSLLPQTSAEKLGDLKKEVERLTKSVASSIGESPGSVALFKSNEDLENLLKQKDTLVGTKVAVDQLIKARNRLKELTDAPLKPPSGPGGGGGSLGSGKAASTAAGPNKLKDAVDAYTKSLQNAIEKEEEQRIKLQFGEITALKAAQAFDVLALKARLVADKVVIPPDIARDAEAARQTLISLGVNVDQLSSDKLPLLRDAFLQAAEANMQFAKAMEAANKQMELESRIRQENINLQAEARALQAQFNDLMGGARIGAIKDPEVRRIAEIEFAFIKMAKEIEAKSASLGKTEAQIAEDIAEAWKGSLNDITKDVGEASQFQIEALRAVQDAMASFIEDALNGNLKGWKAWADGVMKTINRVVSQAAAKELNEIIFGKDAKAPIGSAGVLGQGVDWLKSLFGGAKPQMPAPTGPGGPPSAPQVPTIGTSVGAGVETAAIATIEAQSVTATAAIQAELMTAVAGIQSQTSIGAGAIDSVAAVAIAAVEEALARIELGRQSGEGSEGGGLTGKGGFGDMFDSIFGQPTGTSTPGGSTGTLFSTGGNTGQFSVSGGNYGSFTDVGAMASGGRLGRMMPSIVGERGPELFVPDMSGTVVANGKWGMGGGTNVVNMNVNTPDAASFKVSQGAIQERMWGALRRQR